MKTPKELDIIRRAVWFEDTPDIIDLLRNKGDFEIARHLHKMHIYHKHLIAEIRKLRRELRGKGIQELNKAAEANGETL